MVSKDNIGFLSAWICCICYTLVDVIAIWDHKILPILLMSFHMDVLTDRICFDHVQIDGNELMMLISVMNISSRSSSSRTLFPFSFKPGFFAPPLVVLMVHVSAAKSKGEIRFRNSIEIVSLDFNRDSHWFYCLHLFLLVLHLLQHDCVLVTNISRPETGQRSPPTYWKR